MDHLKSFAIKNFPFPSTRSSFGLTAHRPFRVSITRICCTHNTRVVYYMSSSISNDELDHTVCSVYVSKADRNEWEEREADESLDFADTRLTYVNTTDRYYNIAAI